VQWTRYKGPMDELERDRIRSGKLYQIGDTVLIWANEGDLYITGTEIPS
jgi:hypothetical protein